MAKVEVFEEKKAFSPEQPRRPEEAVEKPIEPVYVVHHFQPEACRNDFVNPHSGNEDKLEQNSIEAFIDSIFEYDENGSGSGILDEVEPEPVSML
jgi:hypothetical protein